MTTATIKNHSFGLRLRNAREAAALTLDTAAVKIGQLYWGKGPSRETIRYYETGVRAEESADPLLVLAMSRAYNVPIDALSTMARTRISDAAATVLVTTTEGGEDGLSLKILGSSWATSTGDWPRSLSVPEL